MAQDGGARHRGQRRDRPLAPPALARDGGYDAVTLDLTPLPDAMRPLVIGELRGQHHGPLPARPARRAPRGRHGVPPRRAPLDARRARPRARAPGQRGGDAQRPPHGAEPVVAPRARRCASSSRAPSPSTACPRLEEKHARRAACARRQWNVPITMYGCNKLYCEHLGRYFTFHCAPARRALGAPRASTSARSASPASSRRTRCPPAARATSARR